MVYEVFPAGGITTGEVDRMPDSPMQPWYETRPRALPLKPWMLEFFPSRMTLHPAQGKPTDVVMLGYWGVRQEIKDLIQRLELGVHQFIPFKLVWGPSERRTITPYYTVKINVAFECVKVDLSDVRRFDGIDSEGRPTTYWSKKRSTPLVLDRVKVAGHHLWIGDQRRTYISTELHDALTSAGLGTGWAFERQIVE